MYAYFAFSFLVFGLALIFVNYYLEKKGKVKSFLFYGGLFYVLLALPILFSWYAIIAIVMLLIGIMLIILSKFKVPKFLQIILVILPFALFFSWSIYQEASYNIFLIPKGYTGRVVIVHGCKDGLDTEFEGRYRVYRISPNGLLKTKFNFAGSSFDHLNSKFYYVDETGKRQPLAQNLIEKDKVSVYGLWTLPYNHDKETNIDFIVDNYFPEAYSYKSEENQKWQKEIDSCRD